LLSSIYAQRRANEETEKDFQGALGALTGSQGQARSLYADYGKDALREAGRQHGRDVNEGYNSLASAGLANTTLMGTMRRRAGEAYGRTQGALREGIAKTRADFETGAGRDVASLYASRTRAGPSDSMYSQLAGMASAPQAVNTSGSSTKNMIGSIIGGGLSAFGPALLKLSDERTKKNVHLVDDALNKVLAMRGYEFEYIDPTIPGADAGPQIGVMAQEVERVVPGLITEHEGYKYVKGRGFEALFIEAIRELTAQVTALQKDNANLRKRIDKTSPAGV